MGHRRMKLYKVLAYFPMVFLLNSQTPVKNVSLVPQDKCDEPFLKRALLVLLLNRIKPDFL